MFQWLRDPTFLCNTCLVFSTAWTCFFHLHKIQKVRHCLSKTCCRILVQVLIVFRIDYFNSVLSNLPSSTLQPLSSILHAASCLIKDLSPRDHITALKQLPICAWSRPCIAFKISLLMYHIRSGTYPSYMWSVVRGLSCNSHMFCNHAFLVSGLENGTVFQLQFVYVHLLSNLSLN